MRNLIKKKSNQKILEHLNRLKLITIKKLSKSTYKNKKIKADIDKLKEAFNKSQDDYEDYSDLVNYIKMIKEEKEKIKSWKEEQERIKKQR